LAVWFLSLALAAPVSLPRASTLIDDFSGEQPVSALGTRWRLVSDRVMGGASDGRMSLQEVEGRRALCMRGEVSLKNNGGFLQLALDLAPARPLDASTYQGMRLLVLGNGERYNVHLKTEDIRYPWQSYRSGFETGPQWREIRLPFGAFEPYRVDSPLDLRHLTRLGLVAIGRAFEAEVCVAEIGLY
jgi:hypothetical protein